MAELRAVHKVLRVTVEGPVLVGGHTNAARDVTATTATLREHGNEIPVLTASALKGALREAALLIERSEGPGTTGTPMSWSPARVGEASAVERLFGTRQARIVAPDAGEPTLEATAKDQGWLEVGVRISDARPVGEVPPLGVRHGVSIDRFTRARSRGRLYSKRVAECAKGQDECHLFEATVTGWLDEDGLQRLSDAAAMVTRLGNSTSRGLGRVRLELADAAKEHGAMALELPADRPSDGELWVEVEALEPLHLGSLQKSGNVRETLDFVPGGALRGALVAAARRAGRANPALAALVEAEHLWKAGSFLLSDLLPVDAIGALPIPAPLTLLADKRDPKRCRADRCLALAVAGALAAQGLGVARLGLDAGDEVSLDPVGGRLRSSVVRIRLVTRLALDPATRSKAHGQLYAVEQIEPGARFLGTLSGVSQEVWDALTQLSSSGEPVLVGGLRSRGLGQVRVRVLVPKPDDLQQRLRTFRKRTTGQLGVLAGQLPVGPGEPHWDAAKLIAVVARTPLAAPPGEDIGTWLARELFDDKATLRGAWVRTESRSGWLDHLGKPSPVFQAASAGSTWLFQVQGDDPLPTLRSAERLGLGKYRELGLGRLIFSPDTDTR